MDQVAHYGNLGWTRENDKIETCPKCGCEHAFHVKPPPVCDVCGQDLTVYFDDYVDEEE